MSEKTIIDARGLSCPEPALRARKAVAGQTAGTIAILVDSGTARDNVARVGENAGWSVKIEMKAEGHWQVLCSK
jgi:tRNA 2-thiouridine synthesizing protein A